MYGSQFSPNISKLSLNKNPSIIFTSFSHIEHVLNINFLFLNMLKLSLFSLATEIKTTGKSRSLRFLECSSFQR